MNCLAHLFLLSRGIEVAGRLCGTGLLGCLGFGLVSKGIK
jgi:hypothetical protein